MRSREAIKFCGTLAGPGLKGLFKKICSNRGGNKYVSISIFQLALDSSALLPNRFKYAQQYVNINFFAVCRYSFQLKSIRGYIFLMNKTLKHAKRGLQATDGKKQLIVANPNSSQ